MSGDAPASPIAPWAGHRRHPIGCRPRSQSPLTDSNRRHPFLTMEGRGCHERSRTLTNGHEIPAIRGNAECTVVAGGSRPKRHWWTGCGRKPPRACAADFHADFWLHESVARSGLLERIGEDRLFPSVGEAVTARAPSEPRAAVQTIGPQPTHRRELIGPSTSCGSPRKALAQRSVGCSFAQLSKACSMSWSRSRSARSASATAASRR